MDARIENIVANLKRSGRYSRLLDCIVDPIPQSFLFELLFANRLDNSDVFLSYEVNVNPSTNMTVDFVHEDDDGTLLCFELVSPEMSNELRCESAPVKTEIEGVSTYSVLLESRHENPYLRPEALTIRMQEKLLEKVGKFPEASDDVFSTIVVNCSAFHFGHFDDEDCRMVVFGKTKVPYLQEYWEGKLVKGILNPGDHRRGAKEFRERITAVIFVPKKEIELLDKAFLVLNVSRPASHLQAFWLKLRDRPIFGKLKYVQPAQ
ncbi:MAG: hypothetical protein ABSC54_04795 [Smithellaceae bacterium]|jgi:hypothetical protein